MEKLLQIANWLSNKTRIRSDYILHFGGCSLSTYFIGIVSFLIVNILFGYTTALPVSFFGAVFALGLSFGKEFGDIPTSGWSWGDLAADGLGILIGYTFLTITIWLVNVNFHIA